MDAYEDLYEKISMADTKDAQLWLLSPSQMNVELTLTRLHLSCWPIRILKQKSLATHHRIRILITEFQVEINTNLIRLFCSKCDFNLIQYQIMQNFICMERSACHKMFFKRTQCQYFEHSPCASETVPDNYNGHSRTRDSSKMLYKADLLSEMAPVLMGSERNGPPVEFVIFSVCPISGGLQSTFLRERLIIR